jgi:RNA polymerase sigma factor (sigma-70 family)
MADALRAEVAPEPRSHAEILGGVIRGDAAANAALYDALSPVVVRTLQKILRDPRADYDDLVQTTFERIVRALIEKGGASVTHLSAWAGGIAAHVALDALRTRIRDRKLFDRDPGLHEMSDSAVGPSLERQLDARRKLRWVQGALARMKPEQAQTLLLHDVMGHDLAETASITGVSFAAAQKRLWRARKELVDRANRSSREDEP